MLQAYHDLSRVTVRSPDADAGMIEDLHARVVAFLAPIGVRSRIEFKRLTVPRPGTLTYKVANGTVQSGDMERLVAAFPGTVQASDDGVTFICVPTSLSIKTDRRHLLWRHIYVAGMVLCACGALYFSGLLEMRSATAAESDQ